MFLHWFKRSWFTLLSFLIFFILLPVAVMAQPGVGDTIDWSQLGVDTAIVSGIIAVVQFLKSSFLKDLPGIAYWLGTVIISALAGYVMHNDAATQELIRYIFAYATAAGFLYDGGSALRKSKTAAE